MEFESFKSEDTFTFGKECGCKAKPGQVYCLYGDLGVGKTVFTQGFAAGLGIREPVSSPTFTIVQIYEEGRIPLYHFDVYRISDPEEMYEVGLDEYMEGEGVTFIEWANLIEELLPEDRVEITIQKDLDRGFDYRKITVQSFPEMPKEMNEGVGTFCQRKNEEKEGVVHHENSCI